MKRAVTSLASFAPLLLSAVAALLVMYSAAAASYSLEQTVMDGGGGSASSEHYSFTTSITEPIIGDMAFVASGAFVSSGYIGALNEAPVALPDRFSRTPGQPLRVAITNLLANDFEFEGQSVTFLSVSPQSALGVPLTIENGFVVYNSTNPQTVSDSFAYTVVDPYGSASDGVVSISGGGARLSVTISNGLLRLTLLGNSSRTYQIQGAESLSPANWHSLGSITADQLGTVTFSEVANVRFRFYRALEL